MDILTFQNFLEVNAPKFVSEQNEIHNNFSKFEFRKIVVKNGCFFGSFQNHDRRVMIGFDEHELCWFASDYRKFGRIQISKDMIYDFFTRLKKNSYVRFHSNGIDQYNLLCKALGRVPKAKEDHEKYETLRLLIPGLLIPNYIQRAVHEGITNLSKEFSLHEEKYMRIYKNSLYKLQQEFEEKETRKGRTRAITQIKKGIAQAMNFSVSYEEIDNLLQAESCKRIMEQ